jgi:hypothetical protein
MNVNGNLMSKDMFENELLSGSDAADLLIRQSRLAQLAAFLDVDDDDDEEDAPVPTFYTSSSEAFMDESASHGGGSGSRRNEDIALDLMKFVAMTTGYGRVTSSGVGFQGGGSAAKPEDYAAQLLELYGRCLQTVQGKK